MSNESKPKSAEVLSPKIWLEADVVYGGWHVMLGRDAPGAKPFKFATFYYRAGITDNASVLRAATAAALRIGAVEPVEQRFPSAADAVAALRSREKPITLPKPCMIENSGQVGTGRNTRSARSSLCPP